MKKRCKWCNLKNEIYVKYHDEEWCKPNFNEKYLYEMLILESFQAGLSWECVLNKRENFRKAFDGFDIEKVCNYDDKKIRELMENKDIIRNKLKISASINNSKIFKKLQEEFGSFYNYLKTFTNENTIYETDKSTNKLSDDLSSDLKRRGMKFVGSTIIYSYLQAIGVIYSHDKECFLYKNFIKNEILKNIDIPKEIEEIIIDISKGVLDIENANRTIEYETKKRLENRPKTIFRLTEEQVKRQIFIQIKTALKDSPEQYYLENPERSILQMEQLMGGELEQNIRTVVDNLLELKDFERAKEVCNTFLNKSEENSFITYIRTLKKQINNTELGDIILKGIKTTGTAREERAYLNLIEKGLKAGNVKLESISLGKSQDGLRKISLADVWTDEKQR